MKAIAKGLVPARVRHLARTELNMLRDDGVRKAASYNWMLADAWAWREAHPRGYADRASDRSGPLPAERMAATAG